MTTAIWWIRRDLRLDDNPTLQEAVRLHDHLLPLFILDQSLLSHPAEMRKSFMFGGLRQLDESLRRHGSRLTVLQGDPQSVLEQVYQQVGAAAIYATADYSPYSRKRDTGIAARLPLWLVHGLTVFPPGLVQKADGSPYTVYTPFNRAWKALPLPASCGSPADLQLKPLPAVIPGSLPIPPAAVQPLHLEPGEQRAAERLERFLSGPLYEYRDKRDLMAEDGTSMLSPYLRFGMLSIRCLVRKVTAAMEAAPDESARRNAQTWLDELVWREFYYSIMHHFPEVLKTSFRKDLRAIPWRDAPSDLKAWKEGRTGYPIVDAGMRQLQRTGWMHNRARMITASFLVKDLLVNWQEGEAWFMEKLVDGDPASNNGGWQWTAGVGTDAAPYFRIFNPTLQGQKFDPQGSYIRRWVPELSGVPDEFIHEPWKMPQPLQEQARCLIGSNYPAPIVDHHQIKERTLQAYRAAGTAPAADPS